MSGLDFLTRHLLRALAGPVLAGLFALAGMAIHAGATAAPTRAGEPIVDARLPEPGKLSDQRRVTRVVRALDLVRVRNEPSHQSRQVARLRYFTEDGYPEVYLALRRHIDARGREWIKLRVPMRPRGARGWVRRWALRKLRTVNTHLIVNRSTLRASLYRDGRRIWRARVGVGKRSTRTPGGRFWIRERIRSLQGGTLYGPWAFGTSAYAPTLSDWPGGGVVGIHGTNEPQLIPGRPSHGCIRLRNPDIVRLRKLMPVGTPVRIL